MAPRPIIFDVMIQFFHLLVRDLPLKLFSLAIAVLIWFLAIVEQNHQVVFELLVRPQALSPGLVIIQESVSRVRVTVQAKGRDLLNLYFSSPMLPIDLSEVQSGPIEFEIRPESVLIHLDVVKVEPDRIEFLIDELAEKPVDLYIPVRGSLPPGLSLARMIAPESVLVRGGAHQLASLSALSTEPLRLDRYRKDHPLWLKVVQPKGLRIDPVPESVRVELRVEPTLRREFSGLWVEHSSEVKVSPAQARVVVSGPKSLIDRMAPESLKLLMDTETLPPGSYELPAEIMLPDGIYLEECEPARFQVKK